jgi:hypothetical protein
MMYLCIVIEVIQKSDPERTIVMIPGTHPSTLEEDIRVRSSDHHLHNTVLTKETRTEP